MGAMKEIAIKRANQKPRVKWDQAPYFVFVWLSKSERIAWRLVRSVKPTHSQHWFMFVWNVIDGCMAFDAMEKQLRKNWLI